MQTNTKQTPKSCSCAWCHRGKSSAAGHAMMKSDERNNRRFISALLRKIVNDEEIEDDIYRIHKGNFYD
jgi:hypothetical protein